MPASFDVGSEAYVGPGTIYHSEFLDGLEVDAAKKKIAELFRRAQPSTTGRRAWSR